MKFTAKEVEKFWSENKSIRDGNHPSYYAMHLWRSFFLADIMHDKIPGDTKIVEIGSGIGRNLSILHEVGYKNLAGIEPNKQSLVIGESKLYQPHWKITNKFVQDCIKDMDAECYISMAVLMHIHPDHDWVFEEIAKAKYLVTIEMEKGTEGYAFIHPRNYKEIFKDHEVLHEEKVMLDKSQMYEARVYKKGGD